MTCQMLNSKHLQGRETVKFLPINQPLPFHLVNHPIVPVGQMEMTIGLRAKTCGLGCMLSPEESCLIPERAKMIQQQYLLRETEGLVLTLTTDGQ